jgi:hypothetical protein
MFTAGEEREIQREVFLFCFVSEEQIRYERANETGAEWQRAALLLRGASALLKGTRALSLEFTGRLLAADGTAAVLAAKSDLRRYPSNHHST